MKLTERLSFEESKRIVDLGFPIDLEEYACCYVVKPFKQTNWIGGPAQSHNIGEFVCYEPDNGYHADDLIPAPTYAEAIDWLVEQGKMKADWDFAKAVTDALG